MNICVNEGVGEWVSVLEGWMVGHMESWKMK